MANYMGPTTHFEMDSYANPTGSRNLEPEQTDAASAGR
jgi:hypothetical protein